MLPTKLRFIWLSGFRGEDLIRNQPIRNKKCLWWPCLLTNQKEMSKFYRCFLPSFASFGQVGSEEEILKNQPIRNKNCLWQPCLLTCNCCSSSVLNCSLFSSTDIMTSLYLSTASIYCQILLKVALNT